MRCFQADYPVCPRPSLKRDKRLGLIVVPILLLASLLSALLLGLFYNATPSAPRGLWRDTGPFDPMRDQGAYVRACLPESRGDAAVERGYIGWSVWCHGAEPMLKRVWAVPGDAWTVTERGVLVNDRLVPNTRPLRADGLGRPLPRPQGGIVPPGYVLLLNDYHPRSFDGRYFGLTPMDEIIAKIKPVWTLD